MQRQAKITLFVIITEMVILIGRLYREKEHTIELIRVNRSPWSNEYDPELSDGAVPSPTLRKLEVAANDAFDTYREMYYEGGVSSVYAFEIDDKFAVVVLIKKGKNK